jgi:uncharacterized SAM-binding protein YcdF (DUF218 family)
MLAAPAGLAHRMTPQSHSPRARRWQWRDLDAWHAMIVASALLVATGGTLLLAYGWHIALTAARAPARPQGARHLLVFGKRLRQGVADEELIGRVHRAHKLLHEDPTRVAWLLGGRTGDGPSEAEAARDVLRALGLPAHARVELEAASAHTLENLRHARALITDHGGGRVALISSRYHLARCALLAKGLGLDYELCAAEDRLAWTPSLAWALARESVLIAWLDLGTRYARLIGHRRMLDRVT